MKIQVEEGISNWLLGTIVLACGAPAITLNVWPRIETMLSGGPTSNQLGIVLLVTLSALGMTVVPFAMKKAENIGFWLTCLLFGIFLGILNYTMAVGAVGKTRDAESDSKKQIIEKASSLRRSIAENEEARRTLPPFKWTSQEMVASASQAVSFAREAQEAECKIVKDICRARIAQLSSRQSELAATSADRAATERAERLDANVRDSRRSLEGLGNLPESSDMQASRIASVVGVFLSLGPGASEKVATGLIHFLALCAEAFALGMPRIIVTALAREKTKEKDEKPNAPLPPNKVESKPPALPIQPKRRQALTTTSKASVAKWHELNLMRSAGKLRAWDAYSHYKDWSANEKHLASPFPAFNETLQGLGVKCETDLTKRDFYLDVAIKTPLKAVS